MVAALAILPDDYLADSPEEGRTRGVTPERARARRALKLERGSPRVWKPATLEPGYNREAFGVKAGQRNAQARTYHYPFGS
ncbi:hypothetical protein RSAG8_13909, partial [Rhizoctonia solani AG-8 WAC10335]